jgi:hypothetical protein
MEEDRKRFEAHVFAPHPAQVPSARRRARCSCAWPPSGASPSRWPSPEEVALMVAHSVRQPGPRSSRIDDETELYIKGARRCRSSRPAGSRSSRSRRAPACARVDRIRFVVQRERRTASCSSPPSTRRARSSSTTRPAGPRAPRREGPRGAPRGIELDDTLGAERVFASSRPALAAADVQKALERWPSPPGLDAKLVTLQFEKEPLR